MYLPYRCKELWLCVCLPDQYLDSVGGRHPSLEKTLLASTPSATTGETLPATCPVYVGEAANSIESCMLKTHLTAIV